MNCICQRTCYSFQQTAPPLKAFAPYKYRVIKCLTKFVNVSIPNKLVKHRITGTLIETVSIPETYVLFIYLFTCIF